MVPVYRRAGTGTATETQCDKQGLIEAISNKTQAADELQQLVGSRLSQVHTLDPHQLHDQVNQVLLKCICQVFPPRPKQDGRVSAQAPYKASARETWRLYAALRRPRVATMAAVLHKWKLSWAFARASRALRQQSRDLKRAAFQDKLAQAEAAAARGDQRVLNQIVRSLTPSSGRFFSRLRNEQGQFLTKEMEVQALVRQGKSTYAQYPDQPIKRNLTASLEISDQEMSEQLRSLQAAKAVPSHMAPAAAWKACAHHVGPLFGAAFRAHLGAGRPGLLRDDLTDCQMVMLPKPGKPGHLLENLRPIGLMGPPSKALAGVLRNRMTEWLQPLLRYRPQFAYTANRGTMDALLRIHWHVSEATELFRSNRIDRFGLHRGKRPLDLAGALSLSLDLSRAFDLADRPCIYNTLAKHGVPPEVIEVAQRLHTGARFTYRAGSCQDSFVPTNGLKQGCKVAPSLWVWYTIALMDALADRLSEHWVRHILTIFADDCWASWLLRSLGDLHHALRELQILLCTLEDFKMKINFSKTAILLKLVGKQARHALHDHTCMKNGIRHLRVLVHGTERLIPIKVEHEYLGSRVGYHNAVDSNTDHRLQAGHSKFLALRRTLTGHHAITQRHRVRLWAACVSTSYMYSLSSIGVTAKGRPSGGALGLCRQESFSTEHALRIHCGVKHQDCVSAKARKEYQFDVELRPEPEAFSVPPERGFSRGAGPLRASSREGVLVLGAVTACQLQDGNAQRPPQQRRPKPQGRGPKTPADPEAFRTLARLVMRQEDLLAELRMDKNLILFMRTDEESILPGLIEISRDWNDRKAAGDTELTSPLRTVLLACLMRQLKERITKMTSEPEGIQKLQGAGWMNQAEEWTYFRWCRQAKQLKLDESRRAVPQPELLSWIDFLLQHLRGDIIHTFHSTQKLLEMEAEYPSQAVFMLSVSLRTQKAEEVFDHFLRLIGLSAMQLIGTSMKRAGLGRSKLAKQVAAMAFR
ncbi:unnamed protein product [Symbiodinium necroappetens]|uniref:Reverse transcriptase domain-containing protein n=1 Tax=Symbiodinium necroappetens TaxID=1628268 RepID=A0A812J049_9DINO|nr:unnamed protein product [Symbiodinium necroappetens]